MTLLHHNKKKRTCTHFKQYNTSGRMSLVVKLWQSKQNHMLHLSQHTQNLSSSCSSPKHIPQFEHCPLSSLSSSISSCENSESRSSVVGLVDRGFLFLPLLSCAFLSFVLAFSSAFFSLSSFSPSPAFSHLLFVLSPTSFLLFSFLASAAATCLSFNSCRTAGSVDSVAL